MAARIRMLHAIAMVHMFCSLEFVGDRSEQRTAPAGGMQVSKAVSSIRPATPPSRRTQRTQRNQRTSWTKWTQFQTGCWILHRVGARLLYNQPTLTYAAS